MVEAVRTTASPAAIWAICVVAVGCLAFWLGALAVADRNPYWRHWRNPDMPGPALGGTHVAEGGRSVSPDREAPAVFGETLPEVPAPRAGDADRPEHSVAEPGTADPRQDGG